MPAVSMATGWGWGRHISWSLILEWSELAISSERVCGNWVWKTSYKATLRGRPRGRWGGGFIISTAWGAKIRKPGDP